MAMCADGRLGAVNTHHRIATFRRSHIVRKMTLIFGVIFVVVMAVLAGATMRAEQAASAPANPLSAGAKRTNAIIKNYITKAAAKMPEENYAFKATPDVRSFGQLVGHVADANYGFCSLVAGEKPPAGGFDGSNSIEKTKTSKDRKSVV